MNWQLLFPLLVTSIVTMVGWYIIHHLARKRDFDNKKKEIRINYLIEAWRKLEYVANRETADRAEAREKIIETIEQSIADIQLFGTSRQVDLVKTLLANLKEQHKVSLDDLLEELRQDLRKELRLEKIVGKIHFFRINR